MNAERGILRWAAVAVLAGAFAGGAAGQKTSEKPAPPAKSLIRKEWLKAPAEPPVPPRRDIFSSLGGGTVEEGRYPIGRGRPIAIPAEKKAEEETAPAFALRYIGFSRSAAPKKIVALVLIDGQAQAVEEGDKVGAGYTVARITLKEIEIQAPDGTTLKFAWSGAER
jgi:hypothetical protein